MWHYIIVFILAALTDAIWAAYIIQTSKKAALSATILSGLIMSISAYITMAYLEDKTTLIAAVTGGMLGTYLTVRNTK